MAVATFEDVAVRFYRPLTKEEQPLVEQRLQDAENKIRRRVRNFDVRVLEDPEFESVVVQVCCDAVIRLVRNPEGYVEETDGNYSYQLSQGYADGRLTILPEEWIDLGVRRRVGVVHANPLLPGSLGERGF